MSRRHDYGGASFPPAPRALAAAKAPAIKACTRQSDNKTVRVVVHRPIILVGSLVVLLMLL